jgi:hypothetical protein
MFRESVDHNRLAGHGTWKEGRGRLLLLLLLVLLPLLLLLREGFGGCC